MTESDERRLAEIEAQDAAYIRKHGHTFGLSDLAAAAGRHDLLRMLDDTHVKWAQRGEGAGRMTETARFPKPQRKNGSKPCGECYLQPDETCDICGARQEPNAASLRRTMPPISRIGIMAEADEWRIRDIRIAHSGRTHYTGREEPNDEFLLRMLDAARAENARILAMLQDPPEDVVYEVSDALFSELDFPKIYYSRMARAALSALAGKIAEGQPNPLPDQIPILNHKEPSP